MPVGIRQTPREQWSCSMANMERRRWAWRRKSGETKLEKATANELPSETISTTKGGANMSRSQVDNHSQAFAPHSLQKQEAP